MSSIIVLISVLLIPLVWLPAFLAYYSYTVRRTRYNRNNGKKLTVGFFHPYCNAGGGGERVLWQLIDVINHISTHIKCIVYTGDTEVTSDQLLYNAENQFNLRYSKSNKPSFIYLTQRHWVEASRYPYFTMLFQSLGSLILCINALHQYTPDIYIDTMGYAFTYPIARYIYGCTVYAYVHYPTISTDMLSRVSQQQNKYNTIKYNCKLLYYNIFAKLYRLVGSCSELNMCNSTWTYNHIIQLWSNPKHTHIVYPPVDVSTLIELPLNKVRPFVENKRNSLNDNSNNDITKYRHPIIVSIGQFRPEKNHSLQLHAFSSFLQLAGKYAQHVQLVLIGGCRNSEDEARVAELERLADELDIRKQVTFAVNVTHKQLVAYLSNATAGIHTMWNEHFGIGIVEFMAAGVIPIAHNSAGPAQDIVINYNNGSTGYLATTESEYASILYKIFCSEYTGSSKMEQMRERARQRATAFSDEQYRKASDKLIETPILDKLHKYGIT